MKSSNTRRLAVLGIVLLFSLLLCMPLFAAGGQDSGGQESTTTGASVPPGEYNESPMLRERVAAGELPPVEERLPLNPRVVTPVNEIGQYGGSWTHLVTMNETGFTVIYYKEPLVTNDLREYETRVPNIAESWEWSEDAASVTFTLREGLKWSDGAPFTTDDVMFWYEHIFSNETLTPLVPGFYKSGDETMKFDRIDDHRFTVSFANANVGWVSLRVGNAWNPVLFAPKHYLKTFHPTYTSTDTIDEQVKKEGFSAWSDLLLAKYDERAGNSDLPVMNSYIPQQPWGSPVQVWERNPYFWKVDTEGNQLPYMDRSEWILMSDGEARILKSIAGDADFQALSGVDNYPLVVQNQASGDYRVPLGYSDATNDGAMFLNILHNDPVQRELFSNKDFRIALSMGINRGEINQIIHKGFGQVLQATMPEGTPWYREEYAKAYTEYDPDGANEILDGMGLTARDSEGYRLRSDGKRIQIAINQWGWGNTAAISEFIPGYWRDLGIQAIVRPIAVELAVAKIKSGDYDLLMYAFSTGKTSPVGGYFIPGMGDEFFSAKPWENWLKSDGETGEEPPAQVKRLSEIGRIFPSTVDPAQRRALEDEVLEIWAENFWVIGMLGRPALGSYYVVSNQLGNVPESLAEVGTLRSPYVTQFFKN